jgi:hypothetical protein
MEIAVRLQVAGNFGFWILDFGFDVFRLGVRCLDLVARVMIDSHHTQRRGNICPQHGCEIQNSKSKIQNQ